MLFRSVFSGMTEFDRGGLLWRPRYGQESTVNIEPGKDIFLDTGANIFDHEITRLASEGSSQCESSCFNSGLVRLYANTLVSANYRSGYKGQRT